MDPKVSFQQSPEFMYDTIEDAVLQIGEYNLYKDEDKLRAYINDVVAATNAVEYAVE